MHYNKGLLPFLYYDVWNFRDILIKANQFFFLLKANIMQQNETYILENNKCSIPDIFQAGWAFWGMTKHGTVWRGAEHKGYVATVYFHVFTDLFLWDRLANDRKQYNRQHQPKPRSFLSALPVCSLGRSLILRSDAKSSERRRVLV